MTERVQMDIFGLTDRGMSQGAFALILKESEGPRKMPIIIGVPEAQAIANELEGVRPQRPMTHDLLRNVIEALGGQLKEIVIHTLKEGTFYASLVFEYTDLEIDARPSDAIAIAVRCGVPIFVTEEILSEAAIDSSEADNDSETDADRDYSDEPESTLLPDVEHEDVEKHELSRREKLESELRAAINEEDYERAARIRDELNKL